MPYMISAFSASHIHLTFSAPISVETEPKRRRVNVGDDVTILSRQGLPNPPNEVDSQRESHPG